MALPTGGLLGDLSHMLNQTSGELQRQQTLLEKRDQTRDEWIAGISHDIRTPLSIMMGYAGQLEDDETLTEGYRKRASIIRVQSQRTKELITNLNVASSLEYGWRGDAFLLRRAIQNLLENSVRHNETGCAIRLSLYCKERKITLAVEDNGIGLPDKVAQWLQSGVYEADKKYGMGLSIAAQITQAHDGVVCCKN